MHIELIKPLEKLHPSIGGTGYQPPARPATAVELFKDAERQQATALNTCVWKVARASVGWDGGPSRDTRRLRIDGNVIVCRVLGGVTGWYFVAVNAYETVKKLTRSRHAALDVGGE